MASPGGSDPAAKSEGIQPSSSSSGFSSRNKIIASNLEKATKLTIQELKEITEDFSEKRLIGQGAYGKVYKGMLANGREIAIKKLYNTTPSIDDKKFQHEFENLMMLEHQNIIRLVGYCYETEHEPIQHKGRTFFPEKIHRALCFKYMKNGSLQKHISDEFHGLEWHTRFAIITGICEGLNYLHKGFKEPIYHLDLKPDNILLDKNMVPKLADFGLSKLFGDEQTRISKGSIGTIGYLPMEYLHGRIVSNKLDIFSLGVVMLKIIAGPEGLSRSTDMPRQEFLDQVLANWRNRMEETILFCWSLEAQSKQVKICTQIALSCVETDRHKRPTIGDIILQLNDIADVLGEVEVCLVGLQDGGKTSLINSIFMDGYRGGLNTSGCRGDLNTTGYREDMNPTIGFNMMKCTKKSVKIKLWDLGGQPRFRSMWQRYCSDVSAILYVVDAADRDSIQIAKSELHNLLTKQSLADIPILIIGNKIDKSEALSKPALVDELGLESITDREVCCYMISCKDSVNIDSVIDWVIKHSKPEN